MGEDDGARVALQAGRGGLTPLHLPSSPHIPPQSINPSTLTRRRMCKVEMISEAEKS